MLETPLMPVRCRRSVAAVLAVSTVLLRGACGSDKSSSPKTTTTTASSTIPASTTTVTFAPVKLGEGSDAQGRISNIIFAGRFIAQYVKDTGNPARDIDRLKARLKNQYPKVALVDGKTEATPTQISALSSTLDPAKPQGAKNPYVLAFAVKDTAGKCVGAVSYGYKVLGEHLTSFINADMGACNAENALKYGTNLIPH